MDDIGYGDYVMKVMIMMMMMLIPALHVHVPLTFVVFLICYILYHC